LSLATDVLQASLPIGGDDSEASSREEASQRRRVKHALGIGG